jgi:formylglycine-generating enzyme required for sulfatase activity
MKRSATISRRSNVFLGKIRDLFSALSAALCISATFTAAARDNTVTLRLQQMSSNGVYRFYFDGRAGQVYRIEASLDLIHWTLLTNANGITGPIAIEDPQASNLERRYYHVGATVTPITNMVFIAPGTFTMGSPASEIDRNTNEGPQTVVTISRGFWIGKYEVTQDEITTLTGTNHTVFPSWVLPVDFATWNVATNYCDTLTATERAAGRLPIGYRYRLPTEAEWEYACRAGATNAIGFGNGTSLSSSQANFDGGFPYGGAPTGPFLNSTTPGGSFAPNPWGLYDMHGNVAEWCLDFYSPYPGGSVTDPTGPATGTTHVLRGGSYLSPGQNCRSAKRDGRSPTLWNFGQGFRVVLARNP